MTLFHLTWDCHVPSILRLGLIPSYRPNAWAMNAANERSRGKLFLCEEGRRANWYDVYFDDWLERPGWPDNPANLVWLAVEADGLSLNPDVSDSPNDDYTGDFWTTEPIPAHRIRVLED